MYLKARKRNAPTSLQNGRTQLSMNLAQTDRANLEDFHQGTCVTMVTMVTVVTMVTMVTMVTVGHTL